jgi:enoyl-CoA hydratase
VTEDFRSVTYRRDGAVGVITWAKRPLNTYDGFTHWEVEDCWNQAKADTDARVVVFMAEGPHFCGGAELRAPGKPRPADVPRYEPWEEFELVRNLPKPTIAAVHGGCVGGGQRMVFPCDLVFCTDDAFFRDPTASMGIGGIQSHLHTWFYGPRLAKEMLYSGMRLPARRLYDMGTVNRLYPTVEVLHEETLAFAHELAAADPVALRQAKRASNITLDIQGMHYVASRFAELMDVAPRFDPGPR